MLSLYIVYYRFQVAGEKKAGPIRQFRLYATSLDEARRLTTTYAQYPNIEVVRIVNG